VNSFKAHRGSHVKDDEGDETMKRILKSLPFLFVFGLIIWTFNSIVASAFAPGKFFYDTLAFPDAMQNIYFKITMLFVSVFLYMILFRIFLYEKEGKLLRKAFNHSFPMCITDFKGNIIEANASYRKIFNDPGKGKSRVKCWESRPSNACHTEACPLVQIKSGKEDVVCEHAVEIGDGKRYYDIKAKPIRDSFDQVVGIIETFNDMTERKVLEIYNTKLIEELKESLTRVKLLSGMLPVCTSCKQVRSDNGYWEQIESYLNLKSDVEIIPSLCPECKEVADLVIDDSEQSHDAQYLHSEDMKWLKVAMQ